MLSRIVNNCSFPFLVAISYPPLKLLPDFLNTPKELSHYVSLFTVPTHTLMHVDVHNTIHLQDSISREEGYVIRLRGDIKHPRDLIMRKNNESDLIQEAHHNLADVGNHIIHGIGHYSSCSHIAYAFRQIRNTIHHALHSHSHITLPLLIPPSHYEEQSDIGMTTPRSNPSAMRTPTREYQQHNFLTSLLPSLVT